MAVHLIKLAVGVDDLAHMKKVQAARRKQRRQSPRSPHWVYTRNTPRRSEELLDGGSLYWVVRGVIRCRQELVGFDDDFDREEARKYFEEAARREPPGFFRGADPAGVHAAEEDDAVAGHGVTASGRPGTRRSSGRPGRCV